MVLEMPYTQVMGQYTQVKGSCTLQKAISITILLGNYNKIYQSIFLLKESIFLFLEPFFGGGELY